MKDVSAAYIAKEEAEQRKPVELYHMWNDGGDHWRHTDGDISVTFDGEVYTPATLKRSSVKQDTELKVTSMSIDVSYIADPVFEFIAMNPIELLWISVSKLHRDQSPLEADVVFIGQIKNVTFKGVSAKAECVGFEHFLKQTVPKWRFQHTCNHMVFDDKCALTEASYKVTATVTIDATKTLVSSATFALQDDGYFTGGKIVFGDEYRTIVVHESNVVTLMYKFQELVDASSVDAYPGCDGRVETCKNKFNNIVHFLGFPFIPTDNPARRVSW